MKPISTNSTTGIQPQAETPEGYSSLPDNIRYVFSREKAPVYTTAARILGALGGSVTSPEKAAAARRNGRRGGRPRKSAATESSNHQ